MGKVECPKCKKYVSEHANYCLNCGFPIKEQLYELMLVNSGKSTAKIIQIIRILKNLGLKEAHDLIYSTPCILISGLKKEDSIKIKNIFEFNGATINILNDNESKIIYNISPCIYKELCKINTSQTAKPQITCPYCNSTNTKKISTVSRAGSILGFGILSKKIGKQWHCNNCGSDF